MITGKSTYGLRALAGPLFLGVDCLNPGAPACAECPAGGCSLRRALGLANRAAWTALENIAVADLARGGPSATETEPRSPKKNLTFGQKP